MHNRNIAILAVLVLFLLISACTVKEVRTTVPPSKEPTTVQMEASSFKFVPNYIQAYKGDRITFEIKNVSDMNHNFTINDPHGLEMRSADLPAHSIIAVPITFQETGIYPFYCNKPLHSELGMKGKVEILLPR